MNDNDKKMIYSIMNAIQDEWEDSPGNLMGMKEEMNFLKSLLSCPSFKQRVIKMLKDEAKEIPDVRLLSDYHQYIIQKVESMEES